jgi:hypothetical protein
MTPVAGLTKVNRSDWGPGVIFLTNKKMGCPRKVWSMDSEDSFSRISVLGMVIKRPGL